MHQIELDACEVEAMLALSDRLQMHCIKDVCCEYLESQLDDALPDVLTLCPPNPPPASCFAALA